MNENFIPMFKKSGDGVANDVLKLKKLELLQDDWRKPIMVKAVKFYHRSKYG